jgi:WD40 repeat protein
VEILDGSRQGQVLHAFCCLSPNVLTPVDIRADLNRLAYGNVDGTVEVWDIAAGVRLRSWSVNSPEPLGSVLLMPDGRRLLTLAAGAEIWDIDSQQSLLQLSDRLYSTAELTPDGQTLLLATCEGDVEVRALPSGELLSTLAGHTGCVADMAFSPDGKLLAVGQFAPIALWDWQTRTVVGQIGQTSVMLSFSPDGSRLAALTIRPQALFTDITTDVYLIDPADLIALARSRVTRALTEGECRQYLHQDSCP